MNLTLQIHEKQIAVQCSMPVQKSTFCFALLNTLKISRFLNNGLPVTPAAAEECQMEFRPPMTKYTFDGLETGELWVEYEGSLSGWFLYMQENVIHFSSYNGWYPAGFDAEKIYDVTLKCDDSWQLVHGSYDAENTCWHYHAQDQSIEDCNILLYKPQACEQMENQNVRILCFNPESRSIARSFFEGYSDICSFYHQLYGREVDSFTQIIFLPKQEGSDGAYKRDGLIVFGNVWSKPDRMLHVLAHEMGHTYGSGADTETWEDWLNETHAEWSALLYQEAHNQALFEQLVAELPKRYQRPVLTLRPDGDKRPPEVHTTGTLLYDGIYQRHGRQAIETLVTTFDQLPVKTTDRFLQALGQHSPALAAEIRACL